MGYFPKKIVIQKSCSAKKFSAPAQTRRQVSATATNLLVDLRLQRSSPFVEVCKFSLALTQVFDDFLFEVIFRVDISIRDQFVSSDGTVLLSNFIFLFLLIEDIR